MAWRRTENGFALRGLVATARWPLIRAAQVPGRYAVTVSAFALLNAIGPVRQFEGVES